MGQLRTHNSHHRTIVGPWASCAYTHTHTAATTEPSWGPWVGCTPKSCLYVALEQQIVQQEPFGDDLFAKMLSEVCVKGIKLTCTQNWTKTHHFNTFLLFGSLAWFFHVFWCFPRRHFCWFSLACASKMVPQAARREFRKSWTSGPFTIQAHVKNTEVLTCLMNSDLGAGGPQLEGQIEPFGIKIASLKPTWKRSCAH